MRIQKYLSLQGLASRREAERLLLAGRITVNGSVVRTLGTQIDPEKDSISITTPSGKKVSKETVALHKPRGITSSRNSREGKTIYQLFPQYKHLHILGRLDKESEGLLLLSNDGVLAKVITGREHSTEKEYEVTVQETITPSSLRPLEKGITLPDGPTLPAHTKLLGTHSFLITLQEGRKHQIRRMCEHLRLTVTKLKRVRIGTLKLQSLQVGESRALSSKEVELLLSPGNSERKR